MNTRRAALVLLAAVACAALACDDDDPMTPEPPWPPLPQTPPENVLQNLVTIYNDKVHTTDERIAAYEDLFLHPDAAPPWPGFVFHFQPADIAQGSPPNWGLDAEVAAHRALFEAQVVSGEIYMLELRLTYGATEPIVDDPEKIGWEEIFASDVYLRLMFNPNDGLEVNGAQASFEFAPDPALPPAAGGRFYGRYWIGEWTDLPRPSPRGAAAVEPTTWGSIKLLYR